MRPGIPWAAIVGAALLLTVPAAAQRGDDTHRRSKNGRAEGVVAGARIAIEYGRPSVSGREVWGALVPYGRVWRTGADEATTVTIDRDLLVEGQRLDAGTYALFSIPGDESWTVIFNRVADQWGAFRYDSGQDALRVTVRPRTHEHVERFEIAVGDDAIAWRWAELEVSVRLSIAD